MSQLTDLPKDLPIPQDDGGADHLPNLSLPDVSLPTTAGNEINLSKLDGRWVIYIYPMTGRPDVALPDGWEAIPGARGCTPQSCSFRDHHAELQALKTNVFGLSTQTTAYQQEAKDRLHLPYEMVSDTGLKLKEMMGLPTMTVADMELYKRLTLIIQNGRIMQHFYPVFPPDQNVHDVLAWLEVNKDE